MKSLGLGLIITAVAATGVIATSVHQARRSATVRLETNLPNLPGPVHIGTPQNVRSANVGRSAVSRPPFLAPAGTTNVALGKPVTTSSKPILGRAGMITDGNKEAADRSCVELAGGLQNVTIDLGAEHDVYAVLVWHDYKRPKTYFDVIVRTAEAPDFLTNVWTLFNNDHDNSAGLGAGTDRDYIETNDGELIDAKGVKARYVRLYSNGNNANDLNHYIEVEVHGKPAK
ncbi:MAG: hypothetical protein A2Z25_10610 [Planctomycetes bacterium RBG_16_55_9]|nr:MAG: hypothetical protein A2Z25_10610 [Planctomycetes bacterium RBG_16_55_9]